MKVAALFVERGGVYFNLRGVDPWDEQRDARLYAGPWPVVAHPPCHLWTNLARVNWKRYGGEHNRPGNDGGCFAAALASVRRWGGVLEHPAGSKAWARYGLPKPRGIGWRSGAVLRTRTVEVDGVPRIMTTWEWSCEVWQSAYGHKARKRTWLYYVGEKRPAELDWTREPGTHQCGSSRTPDAFRDELLRLARGSRGTAT